MNISLIALLWFAGMFQCMTADKREMCDFMNQYCSVEDQGTDNQQQIIEGRRGKAGPRGPPGNPNYTLIDDKIKERYRELEVKMKRKINRNLQIYNEQVEKEKKQSKRIEDLEKKITELESKWKKTTTAQTTTTTALATATTAPTTTTIAQTLTSCVNTTMDKALSCNGTGGIFNISTESFLGGIKVYCDLTSDGGGWIVFQRRMDGSVDFYRGWDEYVNGFGEKDKEFWLGLETIYQLTKSGSYELRVDIGDWEGNTAYAQYGTFSIAGSDDNYRLTVGDYSGNAVDSLRYHNGQQFTTKDRDNDGWRDNCAVRLTGAWWYYACAFSNLNGVYHVEEGANEKNIIWYYWRNTNYDYSYKFTEMKFRKKQN